MGRGGSSQCHPASRRTDAGVTLVEMLVVLSVIAVAAGVVMLRFPGASSASPAAEAVALAATLTRASDQALTTGRARLLNWTADGYQVLQWLPGSGWVAEPGTGQAGGAASGIARTDGITASPVLIGTDALSAPATFRLGTGTTAWRVAFDGLVARAEPDLNQTAAP